MDTGVRLSIVAAVAENRVIGRGEEIPWRLRADLRRFADLTRGHTVIVGRKTYEAILRRLGHPLRDRRTIVLTRRDSYPAPVGCEVATSWKDALARLSDEQEVFVIGGAEIYRLALPRVTRMYLTQVHMRCEGDVFFPSYDPLEWWADENSEYHPADAENECGYTFTVLGRRAEDRGGDGFVVLDHARASDQRDVMERIAEEKGVCPFCPAHRKAGEVLDPIWRGQHWVVVPNRWPYKFATLHLMAISERHVRSPHELTPEEWTELHGLISWVITAHGLTSGAIGIRFGDPKLNGGTVYHLHVHFIVADPDTTKSGYERVRFAMGPKPAKSSLG